MFNWADWAIVALVAVSTLVSLKRGFVKEAMSLAVWSLAILVALMFSSRVEAMLGDAISVPSLRYMAAFAILFFAVLIVGGLVNYLISELVKLTGLTGTDRVLGMVFGFVRGVILVLVTLIFLPGIIPVSEDPWFQQSQLIPKVLMLEDWARLTAQQLFNAVSGNLQ